MTEKATFWIGLLLAVIGIIAPMLWDTWSQRTNVTVETLSASPILSDALDDASLQILYGNKPLGSAYHYIVRITNSGSTPISAADISEPIVITPKTGKILLAKTTFEQPENIGSKVALVDSSAVVTLSLLNPGDFLTISILAESDADQLSAKARIKDLKELTIINPQTSAFELRKIVSGVGLAFSSLFLYFLIMEALKARYKLDRLAASLRDETNPILDARDQYRALKLFVADFRELTDTRRAEALDLIEKADWPLASDQKAAFAHRLIAQIVKEPNLIFLVVIGPLLGIFVIESVERLRPLIALLFD